MRETVNSIANKWAKQLSEPNSYPPCLFMPLVHAVLKKQGLVAVPRAPLEAALEQKVE